MKTVFLRRPNNRLSHYISCWITLADSLIGILTFGFVGTNWDMLFLIKQLNAKRAVKSTQEHGS